LEATRPPVFCDPENGWNESYTCGEEDWGFQVQQRGGAGGAYAWEPVIKEEADLEKLHAPVLQIDRETTQATVEAAREAFGDFLQVRLTGVWWWSLGMTWRRSCWI
jgi:L-alanine-DL-glutamate epimerase-like enolase superfamily enzyme